jgi:nucleotide-binding universal stress UspA family protein
MTANPTIVVAFDGSPGARAALARAVERVGGGKLFIVHAYSAPADYWGGQHYKVMLERALQRGEDLLGGIADAEPGLTGVDYETELIEGSPADVIANVAEVRHADEILVGTRGFGPVRAALGSVAHGLLHIAPCPVTVIPDRVVAASEGAREQATSA